MFRFLLSLGLLCVIVNAQTTLRCWNLRGDILEEKDCPASPTNGPPYCTHYDFQGSLLVACSNEETCQKLTDLSYPNFVCCNTTLCNYPPNMPPAAPPTNGTVPEPDPAETGEDGVSSAFFVLKLVRRGAQPRSLQCYESNDDLSDNKTVIDCPDLQNSKARCAVYTRIYDIPDDDLSQTVISQCSHELQCSDMAKQSWITDLKCCNDDLCNDPSGGGLPGWAIAIIVVVIIVVVAILLVVLYMVIAKGGKAERV